MADPRGAARALADAQTQEFAAAFKAAVAAAPTPFAVKGLALWGACVLRSDEGEGAQQILNLQGLAEIYPEVKPFADYVMGLRVNALALAARKAIAGQT